MTLPYDFTITPTEGDALGFNKYITKEQPEERATAQFRKEQFDSAPTVGDQSLTGWWTRGQLSFHKGAGIKYYEVLDGDTILNRFQDSTGIDPWTPGEVTLSPSSSDVALANISDAVGATWDSDPGAVALTSDGKLYFADTSASEITSTKTLTSYDFDAITTSGSAIYPVKGDGIYAANGALTTYTNYVTNPKFFSSGATGQFSQYDSANPGLRTAPVYGASGGLTWTVSNTADFHGIALTLTGLTAGQQLRIIIDNDAISPADLLVYSNTPASDFVGSAPDGATTTLTFTPAGTSQSFWFVCNGNGSWKINELTITNDPYVSSPNPIDSALYSWTGSTNASKSTRTVAANSYFDILWNPPTGNTWVGAWWAKGRFFALDSDGKWYTLSTAGGTATEVDNMFWSPNIGTTGWSVAESPGAVYISHGTDVYSVLPDSDGLIPTITTPIVAASFPTGETISTIFAYVGRLIACTNLGIRVALVQSDSSLAYGAHAVEGDFSSTARISALRDLAYVVGTADDDTDPSIFTINMLSDLDELRPVWAKLAPMDAGSLFGGVITPDGELMAWDGNGFYRTGSGLQDEGYVTTGFHRLGTLDPKSFQFLRVKTEGTVGEVAVEAILPDGSEATVGTVAAGTSEDLVLRTAIPDPQEYVAFRFTLTGDGSDGPTLLGYQLKALPVPKRQRMIRVPLMLFDREQDGRTGTKRGQKGDAWTRLAALEALEESNAVVTFTDAETGETGSAYIESIETRRTSPVSSQGDGFGGLLYVTLRRL